MLVAQCLMRASTKNFNFPLTIQLLSFASHIILHLAKISEHQLTSQEAFKLFLSCYSTQSKRSFLQVQILQAMLLSLLVSFPCLVWNNLLFLKVLRFFALLPVTQSVLTK